MDTGIYSQATLDKYIISNVCQDDKTLYKYYTDGKTKEFRGRLSKLIDQKKMSKIALTLCTDVMRDYIYKIVQQMNKLLAPYGDLIVSGGEAFNLYLSKESRVVTGDIDTKFVPGIHPDDPEFFGKLQVVRLAMWDALGRMAKKANNTSMQKYNDTLKKNKLARMLGLQIENKPFRFRYTLLPKQKRGRTVGPREGNVFMDVGIFALDLNVKYYKSSAKRVMAQKLGGILDAPIIRRDEFSSDVYKDFIRHTVRGIPLASKRFLLEDLELLVKYGIRKGDKLKKDKIRLKLFIQDVLKANIKPTAASFNAIMKIAKKHLPTRPKTPKRTIKPFPTNNWRKFNPAAHESLIAPLSQSQLTFLLYPLINDAVPLRRLPVSFRFCPKRARWTRVKCTQRRGNMMRIRPAPNAEISVDKLNKIRARVIPILKKDQFPMQTLLYGYIPSRNDWMPIGLVNKAILIGLLGQLK